MLTVKKTFHCIKLDTAADKFYSDTLAVINMGKNNRMASIPNGVSSDVFLSIYFPKFCFGDTQSRASKSRALRTNPSQQSTSSATITTLSLLKKYPTLFSTSSL